MPPLRLRFSLRTLLLLTAVFCGFGAAVAYPLNWIRQREAFRRNPGYTFVDAGLLRGVGDASAPQALRWFGESGVAFITMEVRDQDFDASSPVQTLKKEPLQRLLRAHALFPEAAIYATDEAGDVVEDLSVYWDGDARR